VAGADNEAGGSQPIAAGFVGNSPTPGALANEPVLVDGVARAHLSSTIGFVFGTAQGIRAIPA